MARHEFNNLVERVSRALPDVRIEGAFLGKAAPDIPTGLDKLREAGYRNIICIPAFLTAAKHVLEDIPALLCAYKKQHSDMTIHPGPELSFDGHLKQAVENCTRHALEGLQAEKSFLLLVGRGSSSNEVNRRFGAVTRHLLHHFPFRTGRTCFADVARPSFEEGLEEACCNGQRNIIILPCLLFSGVLANRINDQIAKMQENYPTLTFRTTPPLRDDPALTEALVSRIRTFL